MTMFIIQAALLFAIAFFLGCIIGSLLKRMFGAEKMSATAETAPSSSVAEKRPVEPSKPEPKKSPAEKEEPVEKTIEKPAAKKPAKAVSKSKPAKAKTASAPKVQDDLKRIKGIGPQNESRLKSIGVTTYAQIAAWSKGEQKEIGERLSFPGRIEREDWVKQAKVLAKGGDTEFAKRVDKGDVDSSKGEAKSVSTGKQPPVMNTAPDTGADDLTQIDGVGNALEKKLNAIGIYKFDQIANWTAEHQEWIGHELGFSGRPERENWVGEAKALASGKLAKATAKSKRGAITAKRKK
ncbi:MAG: hypothetical protein AAGA53_06640 [Pseudomonadota bacterium]